MKDIIRAIVDSVYPQTCATCDFVIHGSGLCVNCWSKITFIYNQSNGKYNSCVIYDEHSKNLLLSLKHKLDYHKIQILSNWIYQSASSIFKLADAIVPIPSHWLRLLLRGHNIPTQIAYALSHRTKLPVLELLAANYTPTQQGKNTEERKANVSTKFYIRTDPGPQKVVLLDDVITTGATMDAAQKILEASGYEVVGCVAAMRSRE